MQLKKILSLLFVFSGIGLAAVLLILFAAGREPAGTGRYSILLRNPKIIRLTEEKVPGYVDVQLIRTDGSARRGIPLEDLTGIVIHYVGNPGSTAQGNRDYFDEPGTDVSAHFVIGLEGEIIQCVPLWEKASASNERNRDTISVECCHPDEGGAFTDETYASLVKLTAWLCERNDLKPDDVIRHYDVTEKICPRYYVENEDAWLAFRADVGEAMAETAEK